VLLNRRSTVGVMFNVGGRKTSRGLAPPAIFQTSTRMTVTHKAVLLNEKKPGRSRAGRKGERPSGRRACTIGRVSAIRKGRGPKPTPLREWARRKVSFFVPGKWQREAPRTSEERGASLSTTPAWQVPTLRYCEPEQKKRTTKAVRRWRKALRAVKG
jgi:hypothetical protein